MPYNIYPMSSALPASFSMEMLSRLPASSFQLVYREIRPDVEPNGGAYPINTTSPVSFHIRSATNEVALNTNIYLCGDVSVTVNYPNAIPVAPHPQDPYLNRQLLFYGGDDSLSLGWRKGATWIDSSRESVNSGSLPIHENTDTSTHLAFNNLRCRLAKRGIKQYPDELGGSQNDDIDDLASAGWHSASRHKGVHVTYQASGGGPTPFRRIDNGVMNFQVPLGMCSDLINTPSVLPTGLLSAYGVNGFSIEIRLADLVNPPNGSPNDSVVNVSNAFRATPAYQVGTKVQGPDDRYRNLRIYVPFIKVLDPAVMQALLNLYEKREMVNIGGASFPMSLRLNSIGTRRYRFSLNATQGDYSFRLPCTDRSVRAIAWYLINSNSQRRDITGRSGLEGTPVNTRLEVRVGSLWPTQVIEDRTPTERNLVKFYSLNARRSGALFSPFPYYQEGMRHVDHQSDIMSVNEWADRDASHNNVQHGVISFENVDRREPDYSGSFQASGYDLTNVGGIDINMRFNHYAGLSDFAGPAYQYSTAEFAQSGLPFGTAGDDGTGPGAAGSWQLLWELKYDQVHEASPSGVQDITNSVL